jgi:hypothetical protein
MSATHLDMVLRQLLAKLVSVSELAKEQAQDGIADRLDDRGFRLWPQEKVAANNFGSVRSPSHTRSSEASRKTAPRRRVLFIQRFFIDATRTTGALSETRAEALLGSGGLSP